MFSGVCKAKMRHGQQMRTSDLSDVVLQTHSCTTKEVRASARYFTHSLELDPIDRLDLSLGCFNLGEIFPQDGSM